MRKAGLWASVFCLILPIVTLSASGPDTQLRERVDPKVRITIEQAQQLFFPTGSTFSPINARRLADQYREATRLAKVPSTFPRFKVWQVDSNGERQGFFFTDDAIGKYDRFDYAVAINTENHIIGVRVLRYRESHGYEIMQHHWLKQFVGLNPESPIARADDIDAITGATLSVDHLSQGVRRLVRLAELINSKNAHDKSQ